MSDVRFVCSLVVFLGCFVCSVGLVGCAPAASAEEGADLYDASCAKCHGADGKSETPVGRAMKAPSLVGSEWATAEPDAFVAHLRANPKHKAPMGKLSDEQLRAIQPHLQQLSSGQ